MVFDFIYHEHLSYLSAVPLTSFMKKFGIHLIYVQEVPTKGGSLRYYFSRFDSKWEADSNVQKILEKEFTKEQLREAFQHFNNKIETEKLNIINYLQTCAEKKIVGYGASATSTTLISHFKLHEHLDYLVDDNPGKIGSFSPGYHIPVRSLNDLEIEVPDIVIILAWRYKDEILHKIGNIPCKVFVPLPRFIEV